MTTRVEELRAQLEGMTEAEANVALRAVQAYRAKVDRPQGVVIGAFDSFLERLKQGEVFSAADVVAAGVSTSRTYSRISLALKEGEIEMVSETRTGCARQPATYRKCK